MTNTENAVRPYLDTVTGDIRCWQIVRGGQVIVDGIATEQDAEDRVRPKPSLDAALGDCWDRTEAPSWIS